MKKRNRRIDFFLKNSVDVQNKQLSKLIKSALGTEYAEKYRFEEIKNYRDFQKRVPLVTYELLDPYIQIGRVSGRNVLSNSKVKWYAKSSGTSDGKSKFIPITDESINESHFKGGKDMLTFYHNNNRNSKLFSGKSLRLGGSHDIYHDKDIFFGDLSAIIIQNMPIWADLMSLPKQKTALLSEWESKMKRIVEETADENITSLVGVPSWMLVLLKKVLEYKGKRNILEVWPNLEVYFHGGVNFSPYRDQYESIIPSDTFRYLEIYNASEGFFAIQDQQDSSDLLLMLDYGIFYEFIPMDHFDGVNSEGIRLSDVKIDENYAIVITTNGGLWRYIIGDTVKFTSLNPHRIRITGRTRHFINVFGEELIVENAEQAIEIACAASESMVKEYTVAPIFMSTERKGAHEWLIEFDKKPDSIDQFVSILDSALKKVNSDYEAKRYKSITLEEPVIVIARENQFYDWLKSKNKLGGQNKVPRLYNDRTYMDEIKEYENEL